MARRLVFFAVVAALLFVNPAFGSFQDENAALQSAENFLELIDNGNYGASWESASRIFQVRCGRQRWGEKLEGIRPFIGRVLGRTVRSVHFRDSYPEAPDGQYVIILFDSSFAHKEHAVEVVTTMLEDDGQWRVFNYSLR